MQVHILGGSLINGRAFLTLMLSDKGKRPLYLDIRAKLRLNLLHFSKLFLSEISPRRTCAWALYLCNLTRNTELALPPFNFFSCSPPPRVPICGLGSKLPVTTYTRYPFYSGPRVAQFQINWDSVISALRASFPSVCASPTLNMLTSVKGLHMPFRRNDSISRHPKNSPRGRKPAGGGQSRGARAGEPEQGSQSRGARAGEPEQGRARRRKQWTSVHFKK